MGFSLCVSFPGGIRAGKGRNSAGPNSGGASPAAAGGRTPRFAPHLPYRRNPVQLSLQQERAMATTPFRMVRWTGSAERNSALYNKYHNVYTGHVWDACACDVMLRDLKPKQGCIELQHVATHVCTRRTMKYCVTPRTGLEASRS